MSLQLLDSQSAQADPITSAIAVDITADVAAVASVEETMTMAIAVDVTGDITSIAFTPFVAPEPGCQRIAVITH